MIQNCSICGKPEIQAYKPFCSRRCADIDLGRWLKGRYAIPSDEDSREDWSEQPPAKDSL